MSLGTYRGTYKATGNSFSVRYAHAWTIKDGKIARFEQIVDSAEADKAVSASLPRRPLRWRNCSPPPMR